MKTAGADLDSLPPSLKAHLQPPAPGPSTGFNELDRALPTGGWPVGAVIEVICGCWGIGELRLFLPLMRFCLQQGRRLAWVMPPYVPYAPALMQAGVDLDRVVVVEPEHRDTEALWGVECLLRSTACAIVLAWPAQLSEKAVRRLQLAAQSGGGLGILFRADGQSGRWETAPVALRLRIDAEPGGLAVEILKARGGCRRSTIRLALP